MSTNLSKSLQRADLQNTENCNIQTQGITLTPEMIEKLRYFQSNGPMFCIELTKISDWFIYNWDLFNEEEDPVIKNMLIQITCVREILSIFEFIPQLGRSES